MSENEMINMVSTPNGLIRWYSQRSRERRDRIIEMALRNRHERILEKYGDESGAIPIDRSIFYESIDFSFSQALAEFRYWK